MNDSTFFGFLCLYLSSSLSSAAGVGGGAVNVAIFYIVMGYSFHQSVVFSLSTLLGNYTLQVLINWNKRHPLIPSRPLIYWDIILLLLPAQLGGADLGVILGYIFPETLLIIFAMVVLLGTSTITLIKGIHLHDKETKALTRAQRRMTSDALSNSERQALLGRQSQPSGSGLDASTASTTAATVGRRPERRSSETSTGSSAASSITAAAAATASATSTAASATTPAGKAKRPSLTSQASLSSSTGLLMDSDSEDSSGGSQWIRDHRTIEEDEEIGLEDSEKRPKPLQDATSTSDSRGREANHDNRRHRTDGEGDNDDANANIPIFEEIYDAVTVADPIAAKTPIIVPWMPIIVVLASWLVYAQFYVLMNDVVLCSIDYFVFFACVYPVLVIEITWGYFYIKSTQQHQLQLSASPSSVGLSQAPYQAIHHSSDEDGSGSDELFMDSFKQTRSKSISYRNPDHDPENESPVQVPSAFVSSIAATSTMLGVAGSHYHPIVKGDIRWGHSIFMPMLVVFLAFCIGITSALLGIGGGELMGPLLLRLKVLPQVSSATVPVMSLLNTSSSIIHYMTIDDFPYEYSVVMVLIGGLGGITGRSIAYRLTSSFKRPSILVFFLVGILMLSVILFAYELSVETADFSFGSYC